MAKAPVIYRIDPAASRFTVQAFAEGLFSAFGHNPKLTVGEFSGEVQIPDGQIEMASLRVLAKAGALTVADAVSEKDRAEIERATRDDVLEAATFLEIVFESKSVSADKIYEGFYRVKIDGTLALHGVSRTHLLDIQVRVSEDSVRAEGESTLKQSDYQIKKFSVAGGTLRVKDEVKISFLIVAEKA